MVIAYYGVSMFDAVKMMKSMSCTKNDTVVNKANTNILTENEQITFTKNKYSNML